MIRLLLYLLIFSLLLGIRCSKRKQGTDPNPVDPLEAVDSTRAYQSGTNLNFYHVDCIEGALFSRPKNAYLINSLQEFNSVFACDKKLNIDFDKYSLLIFYSGAETCFVGEPISRFETTSEGLKWYISLRNIPNDAGCVGNPPSVLISILVSKISPGSRVSFQVVRQ